MKKRLFSLLIVVGVAFSLLLTGCGRDLDELVLPEAGDAEEEQELPEAGETEEEPEEPEVRETVTLVVGATPTPHAQILEQVVDVLYEEGIILEIVEFTDFILPNLALNDGELHANYFQHVPYMESFNNEHGTEIVPVEGGGIHYEPLGIYPGRSDDLNNVPEGAIIAIPNDVTNAARALNLLEANGLITLAEGAGLLATSRDIEDNPHNIEIYEVAAAQLARILPDVDFAVINGNFALQAGLTVENDALAAEDPESPAAQTYMNVVAVRAGDEDNPVIRRLVEVIQSEEIRQFILENYQGAVVPLF